MTFSPPSGGHYLDTFSLRLQERSTLYHYHNQHVDALPNIISTHCLSKWPWLLSPNMGKSDAILSPHILRFPSSLLRFLRFRQTETPVEDVCDVRLRQVTTARAHFISTHSATTPMADWVLL
jgi:hypothetical protein